MPSSMTMTQKILAAKSGKKNLRPGQLITARVDLVMANDITAPLAIRQINSVGRGVFDKDKIVLVLDHFSPNKDIEAAEQCAITRRFARDYGITHFYDVGSMGIEHALIPELGLVLPGELVIGADSHTCTYGALGAFSTGVGSTDMATAAINGMCWLKVPSAVRVNLFGSPKEFVSGKDIILHILGLLTVSGARYKSIEFTGPALRHLSMDDRFTMANMAVEAGAKNGIFEVDDITARYIQDKINRAFNMYTADDDARYDRTLNIDLGDVPLTVALPHSPDNTVPAEKVAGTHIDQVVIGSCTNGRFGDLKAAAEVLRGKRVAPWVRVIVIPATQGIYLRAAEAGLIKVFIEAGCAVSTPTCGPCLGGHMGILADGEVCVATTNRNFVGRMGHTGSRVILASPAVAAASAVAGELALPGEDDAAQLTIE